MIQSHTSRRRTTSCRCRWTAHSSARECGAAEPLPSGPHEDTGAPPTRRRGGQRVRECLQKRGASQHLSQSTRRLPHGEPQADEAREAAGLEPLRPVLSHQQLHRPHGGRVKPRVGVAVPRLRPGRLPPSPALTHTPQPQTRRQQATGSVLLAPGHQTLGHLNTLWPNCLVTVSKFFKHIVGKS